MILSFGEILLRISPDENGEWINKNALQVYAGGAELNVATALAKWKVPVSYCTAMPDNFISKQLMQHIGSLQIDTSTILYHSGKMGLYYLPEANNNHNEDIIFDREYSSFYNLESGIIDWEKVLQGIRWFHFNTQSLSLNDHVAAVCEEALKACKKKSITVSVDLNYDVRHWQHSKSVNEIMPQILQYCDIIMGNIWNIEAMLNIPVPANIHSISTKDNYLQQAKNASEKIIKNFPECKVVAHPFLLKKNRTEYFATLFGNNNFYSAATYSSEKITDKSGCADSFMAGLIYGIYNHLPFQQLINFATGAAFQKLFIRGEAMNKTVDEIKSFLQHYH